jgi:manganese/zinc/iron transport system substrate-binding protein
MQLHHVLLACAFSLSASGIGGCSRSDAPSSAGTSSAPGGSGRYNVVTTVAMITDIVQQVAGDHAHVTGLIGEGVDPHLYKPTRNDIARLQKADIVFYNGLLLEGKMVEALQQLARSKPVHAVTAEIPRDYLLALPDAQGHHDPHVWMDVSAWRQAVLTVAKALGEFDPHRRTEYETNAQRYAEELEGLHAYVKRVIGSIPENRRVLVTAHDAFHYFGRAYGIEVMGIQGVSTESEAGLADINRLVSILVERDVPAVFVESSVADKNVRALLEGAAARGRTVTIGGTLFSDAMGPHGSYEGTYIGMLDHNATVIARALGGDAPERGYQGRLAAPR